MLVIATLFSLLFAWIVLVDAWPWLRGPAPWPPSWRWLHVPLGLDRLPRIGIHALLLLGYGAAIYWLTRPNTRTRPRAALFVAAIFIIVWQLAQTWVREESLLDTLIFRTYAPPLNGYFLAPAQVENVGDTLHHYLQAMPTFFGDKPQTHPPGLFLFYAFFQTLFEHLPRVTGWFAPMARTWAIPGQDWPQLSDPLITSAFTTSLIQAVLIGLTPLSLYAFLRQLRAPDDEHSRTISRWSALLVPLIPSLTLFFLQWDTIYPALGFTAWFLALRAHNGLRGFNVENAEEREIDETQRRKDTLYSARHIPHFLDWLWAGLLLSLLTWLSFGTLVFGLMIGLHVLWREGVALAESRRFDPWLVLPVLGGLALMGLGVVLPWLLAYWGWGMNFFQLMRAGLGAHYEIVTAHREYGTWVWMNLVDFTLWLGPGLVLLGMAGSGWLFFRGWQLPAWRDWAGLAAVVWAVFLLLDLSGATRGEIGRLWIFLMPFPILFTLILPWRRPQRLAIAVLILGWGWVITYTIPPFLCC